MVCMMMENLLFVADDDIKNEKASISVLLVFI